MLCFGSRVMYNRPKNRNQSLSTGERCFKLFCRSVVEAKEAHIEGPDAWKSKSYYILHLLETLRCAILGM